MTLPLVSLVTPTYNRREFWLSCIRWFQSYNYPNLEWVIVDNSPFDFIIDLLPDDSRIHYFSIPQPKLTHGALMNECCQRASGEFFVVHDDDDWYAPDRVAKQIQPISTIQT